MRSMPLPPEAPAVEAPDANEVIPRHGGGRLRPFRPGQSGNPSGRGGRYHEVVRLARDASPEIMATLIGIALDPREDSRARIVACQEVLGRALGKVPAEVKTSDGAAPTLDASALTDRELAILWRLVGGGDKLQ